MPDKITFSDALQPAGKAPGITIDDALAQRDEQSRIATPGDNPGVGEVRVPGSGLPGSPDFNPAQIAPRVQPAENANFGTSIKQELVDDPGTKRKIIAQSLFPNDPNGINRVGFSNGVPVYVDDSGQLREVSGFGTRVAAKTVANAPEAVGATLGSVGGVPGAMLGAAGGRAYKKIADNLIFDEPQTAGGNALDIGGQAALEGAAGLVARGAAKAIDRGKTVDFAPANVAAAEATRQTVKKTTGIDLDLAQASGDRKLISLRAYSARYPGKSAELMQAADEASQGQFEAATKRVLDMVATSKPEEVAGSAGVRAADMVIAGVKQQRDKAVEPLYEAARKVTIGADVVDDISKDPLIARSAKTVAKDPVYQRKLQGLPDNSVGYWQQVKRNLDARYETAINSGNKTAAREYQDAAQVLNEKLAAASPEYKQANDFYAQKTKEIVEPLENSVVGVLAKIKNPKAATAAAKIFQDANVTPSQIAQARSLIAKQDPEAWDGLVRQWLGQKFNTAMKETQTGDVVNPAGKFRQAVFGSPNDRAKMTAMLPQGASQAFEDLMFAAEKLSSTPIAGSNTMRDTEIKDQLKGTGAVVFRWLTQPRASVVNAAEQKALEQGTTQITEALLDPAKRSQLKRVVKMAPSTKQAMLITSILAGKTTAVAASSVDDVTPPALEQKGR